MKINKEQLFLTFLPTQIRVHVYLRPRPAKLKEQGRGGGWGLGVHHPRFRVEVHVLRRFRMEYTLDRGTSLFKLTNFCTNWTLSDYGLYMYVRCHASTTCIHVRWTRIYSEKLKQKQNTHNSKQTKKSWLPKKCCYCILFKLHGKPPTFLNARNEHHWVGSSLLVTMPALAGNHAYSNVERIFAWF